MDGIKEKLEPPAIDEIEVTLIGGTVGYGESILMHIGNGDWIIIDSCVNVKNGECAPLAYLNDLAVDVSQHVLFVLCTHWHDDHIKGLSSILEQCSPKTVFALSCSDDRRKWVYEMLSDYDYHGKSTVLNELTSTIAKANEKKIKVLPVKQDSLVFNVNGVTAYALSPSDEVVKKFEEEVATAQAKYHKALTQVLKLKQLDAETIQEAEALEEETIMNFAELIDEQIEEEQVVQEATELLKYKDTKKIEQNDRCVALLVSFNNHHIVLGADLENKSSDVGNTGWMSVAKCSSMQGVSSSLFKIPHHGSETGYCDFFLKSFIKNDATMKLTAWSKGDKQIPEQNMLGMYYAHSQNMYITTTALFKKDNREENKSIKKEMERTTEAIYELRPQLGIIRSRMKVNSPSDNWHTDYFGSAERISQDHLE